MNFAWSNPTTGIREQTRGASLRDAKEALSRAWRSLHGIRVQQLMIYQQWKVGSITSSGSSLTRELPDGVSFAWADPDSGNRWESDRWPAEVQKWLASDPVGFVNEVIIYAQVPLRIVRRDAPRPSGFPLWLRSLPRSFSVWLSGHWGSPAEFIPPRAPKSDLILTVQREPSLCTCTGDGLLSDGGFCVCQPGRIAAKRAADFEAKGYTGI